MHPHPSGEPSHFPSSISSRQRSLVLAMLEPAFYPRGPSKVEHAETHISHLFFAGELVYKIKKPVRFSFLDYSTLSKRRYFLHEEMRLNRRLAPSVYLGVLPISYGSAGWELGSFASPAEYTLVMRRLPERRMLDFLLERNQVTPQMMQSLAEILARFHAEAGVREKIKGDDYPTSVRRLWEDNLADIRPFVGALLDPETFGAVRDFGERFIEKNQELLMRRAREGRIREVHGDLHCEHICFAPEGIQIFDCLEFSRELRTCDLASETAFLVMDVRLRGRDDLAQEFLNRYLELMGDEDLIALLPFYQCYRALVRGKVAGLRSSGASPEASSYFDYARRAAWDLLKPFIVVVCGLTGSGKSTLSRELGRRLGMRIVSSDATRKALAGSRDRGDQIPYEEGIYSLSMTERSYAKMAGETEALISKQQGVIVDATFQRRNYRRLFFDLAAKYGVPYVVIHCWSPPEVVRERLKRRAEEGQDLSDGRWEIYLKQQAAFEPLLETPAEDCFVLDTEAPAGALVQSVESFLLSNLKNRS